MIKELYEQICAGDEVRANLIRLRDELKNEESRREFAYLLGGDFSNLTALLKDEDPKVRKKRGADSRKTGIGGSPSGSF
ncbi:MAG: hypothetical protein LUI14_13865 [Lachnospiraceae bacterium]|nr:hypothetical protein [Lachnospiraceae bacterium]